MSHLFLIRTAVIIHDSQDKILPVLNQAHYHKGIIGAEM